MILDFFTLTEQAFFGMTEAQWFALRETNSESANITQDVTDLLNDAPFGTFPQAFTAIRRYVPLNSKDSLKNLTVSVVSKSRNSTFISRDRKENMHEVDIAIQKSLASPENLDEIDGLAVIADAIMEYLESDDQLGNSRRILPTTGAKLMQSNQKPLYDMAHIKDDQVYTTLVTLVYETSGAFR